MERVRRARELAQRIVQTLAAEQEDLAALRQLAGQQSGGSLGASIFSSLAKKYAPNGPPQECRLGAGAFEAKVDKFLNRDFLAPIVARAFFADFLQLFLPRQLIVPQFSRGRALEEAIERAWVDVEGEGDNPFANP